MFKGGIKLGVGQIATQLCTFVRSIILARLISPENFGIAAIFGMTYSLLDMMSHLAADVQLVQASDGEEPRFQKTSQAVQTLRGAGNAFFLFIAAIPIARLFGVPQATWAFQCLALVPLTRGLVHLDVNRLQRDMNFVPTIAADVVSNLLSVAAAFPIALWRRDYSAMLWLLILQTAAYVITTHVTAKRRYGWAWDPVYTRRIFSFGWPLLINGLLMYGIFNGDRFIIGAAHRLFSSNHYTLADLGVYSVAFSLVMALAMFMVNITTQLFLPLLSRAQGVASQFRRRYEGCCHVVSLLSASMAIPFILVGGWTIRLVYGQKYAAASAFVGWVAVMFALRLLRVAPTLAAMAMGDTRNAMISNVVRTVALVGVVAAAAVNAPLSWIAACGFLGEAAAIVVCTYRLQREHSVAASILFRPLLISMTGCAVAGLLYMATAKMGIFLLGSAAILILVLTVLAMFIAFPNLREEVVALMPTRTQALAERA